MLAILGCTEEGEVQYPSDINMDLKWHSKVAGGVLIKKDHDRFLVDQLVKGLDAQ